MALRAQPAEGEPEEIRDSSKEGYFQPEKRYARSF
jgi:hypothetical protein